MVNNIASLEKIIKKYCNPALQGQLDMSTSLDVLLELKYLRPRRLIDYIKGDSAFHLRLIFV